jgi:kynurenine 3-monooxygenase
VEVFDRNPDLRDSAQLSGKAINLTLCDRGFKALDEVGVGDHIRSISVPCYGRFVHPPEGPLAYQPYGNKREAIYSILRGDLGKALLNFAEQEPNVRFHFNEKCVGLELSPLRVEFQNSQTGETSWYTASRVFGADGTFSAVRTLLQRQRRFNYSQEFLDQGYKELLVPAAAEAEWIREKEVLHMWPRGKYMLLGFPNMDGSFTCSLHMPFEGHPSFSSIKTATDLRQFFETSFPDVVPHVPNLAEDYFSHGPNPMVTVKCSPWTFDGKVALIGDAAHVLFPYYGQGANAGFEDCSVLSQCLEKHGEDWHEAFGEYERLRKPNMDAIADMCVQHYIEIRDELADPTFLLRKAIERKVNQLYPERYLPLYSMIAFSDMPYAEALRIDREQRTLIDRLMSVKGIEDKWDGAEVEHLIAELMCEFSGANPLSAEAATATNALGKALKPRSPASDYSRLF